MGMSDCVGTHDLETSGISHYEEPSKEFLQDARYLSDAKTRPREAAIVLTLEQWRGCRCLYFDAHDSQAGLLIMQHPNLSVAGDSICRGPDPHCPIPGHGESLWWAVICSECEGRGFFPQRNRGGGFGGYRRCAYCWSGFQAVDSSGNVSRYPGGEQKERVLRDEPRVLWFNPSLPDKLVYRFDVILKHYDQKHGFHLYREWAYPTDRELWRLINERSAGR